MRILLTGCSGYIGTPLAEQLDGLGFSPKGIDRKEYAGAALQSFIHGDILAGENLERSMQEIDCVFHLAAAKDDWGLTDEEYYRDNLETTRVLIDEGKKRGIKKWVFYSTVSVLGPSQNAIDESAPFAPNIAYGASKAEAEQLFLDWAEEDPELEVLIIRPSAVYGPGNPPTTNIYRLIDAISRNRFVMIGDGAALKTTSHLDNLLAATVFLFERAAPGVQTYIYVDEPVWQTNYLVGLIYKFLGRKTPSWYLPLWLARPVASVSDVAGNFLGIDFPITAARIDKFCTSTNFDSGRVRKLGFEQPISNEEALEATVAWHIGDAGKFHEKEFSLEHSIPA